MRLVVAIFIATLAGSTAAQADHAHQCTRVPGDYVGGPNAWMMWTDDKPGPHGGTTYGDIGLTCSSTPQVDHQIWYSHDHVHRHWRHAHRLWRHAHTAYQANWVNVPLENVGGLCPKGHCGLLNNGAHRHYRNWLFSQG